MQFKTEKKNGKDGTISWGRCEKKLALVNTREMRCGEKCATGQNSSMPVKPMRLF